MRERERERETVFAVFACPLSLCLCLCLSAPRKLFMMQVFFLYRNTYVLQFARKLLLERGSAHTKKHTKETLASILSLCSKKII